MYLYSKKWWKRNKEQYNNKINNNLILKEEKNEINCIYIPKEDEKEIFLLHDYSKDVSYWKEDYKKEYIEVKNMNKKLFEENIDIYINDKKIKFDYKYKIKDEKEIKVKFKFNKILTIIVLL